MIGYYLTLLGIRVLRGDLKWGIGDRGLYGLYSQPSLLFLLSSCMVGYDSQLEYEPRVSSLLKLELEGLVLQQAYQSFSWTKTSASFGDWVRYVTLRAKVKV